MITLAEASSWVIRLLFPPFLCILCTTLILASIGKSLGIRRLYVKALIRIFEFAGKLATEAYRERKQREERTFQIGSEDNSEDNSEESSPSHQIETAEHYIDDVVASNEVNGQKEGLNGGGGDTEQPVQAQESSTYNGVLRSAVNTTEEEVAFMRQRLRRLGRESRHNVISRKDNLILSPDRAPTIPEDLKAKLQEIEQDNVECQTNGTAAVESSGTPPDDDTVAADSTLPDKILSGEHVSVATFQREFELDDVLAYVKTGIASIIEDEVTQRFEAEELKCWNLLSRTSHSFEFVNVKLTVIWIMGFFLRYFVLLPGRFCILCVGALYLLLMTSGIAAIPSQKVRNVLYNYAALVFFRVLARSFSTAIVYHNKQYRPKPDGICVANHTTPIDCVILNCDRTYSLVGQRQGGAFGFVQKALSRATDHIWFERSQVKDRHLVAQRLKEHVEDPEKLPILIFPEGTCINNTSVMQFKKGSFEVGGTIYPVAIKYDPLFGDAFWNSSKYGMMTYMLMMMTSWAIVCDVWYLPPMVKGEDEDAITFANRVKAEIARQGGLVDLMWDGNLKRSSVKSEWKAIQQQAFSQRLKVE